MIEITRYRFEESDKKKIMKVTGVRTLARAMMRSPSYISEVLSGKETISFRTLMDIKLTVERIKDGNSRCKNQKKKNNSK